MEIFTVYSGPTRVLTTSDESLAVKSFDECVIEARSTGALVTVFVDGNWEASNFDELNS